jgi:hypothetical protein
MKQVANRTINIKRDDLIKEQANNDGLVKFIKENYSVFLEHFVKLPLVKVEVDFLNVSHDILEVPITAFFYCSDGSMRTQYKMLRWKDRMDNEIFYLNPDDLECELDVSKVGFACHLANVDLVVRIYDINGEDSETGNSGFIHHPKL